MLVDLAMYQPISVLASLAHWMALKAGLVPALSSYGLA